VHRTLASLSECRRPAEYRNTIVVENGPAKKAEQIADGFKNSLNLRYVYLPVGNKSNALNAVLEDVRNSLVFFADDDVRFEPGILEAYAEAASGKESGEFYGGPFGIDYVRQPEDWLVEFLPLSAVGWSLGNEPQHVKKGNLFTGFNWAAFADDLIDLGGFSVDHGPGSKTGAVGQETQMQGRLLESGRPGVYVPRAKVWHFVPPERCSPRWAAMRSYRWGIQGGLGYSGSVMRLYKRAVKCGLKALLNSGNRKSKLFFEPYIELRYTIGLVKGLKVKKSIHRYH
jgi:hypothetical protein